MAALTLLMAASFIVPALAQDGTTIMTGAELRRVVPAVFYFQGQNAQTKIRNQSGVRGKTGGQRDTPDPTPALKP